MSGHTPGPWAVVTVPTSAGSCHRIFPKSWGGQAPAHGGICVYDDRTTLNPHADGEQAANARLIAAAPDLLAAAQSAVAVLTQSAFHPADARLAVQNLTAAITKATEASS